MKSHARNSICGLAAVVSMLAASTAGAEVVGPPPVSAQAGSGGDVGARTWHLTVEYAPAVLAGGSWFGAKDGLTNGVSFGVTMHNLVLDISIPLPGDLRYHGRVGYMDYVPSLSSGSATISASANGARIEPLELGRPIPVYEMSGVHFEIEPTVSLLQLSVFSQDSTTTDPNTGASTTISTTGMLLGFGIGVGLNVDFNNIHAVIKPLNFDVVYFAYASASTSANGTSQSSTQTGGNLMYRFGIAAGVNF
jgi:hypothetical protein